MAELIFNVVDYCHYQTKENEKGGFERFCAYCSTDVFFENTVVHFSYREIEPKNASDFCEYEGISLHITHNHHPERWAEEALNKTKLGSVIIDGFKKERKNITNKIDKKWEINYFLYDLLCDKFSDEFLSEYGIFPEEDYKNQELIYKR